MRASRTVSRSASAALAALILAVASACADDAAQPVATIPPSTPTATEQPATTVAEPTTTSEATTVAPVTTAETTTPATSTPETTAPPTTEPELTSTAVEATAPFSIALDDPDRAFVRWLLPWEDGFLVIAERYEPTGLPEELPPELGELFPPEVVELFPDGLPATQAEAMEILQSAGLFDEAMEVINENPEVLDALTLPPEPPTLPTAWTADGDEWQYDELTVPDEIGDRIALSLTSGRLTLLAISQPDDETPASAVVATTTDLTDWTTDEFTVGEVDPSSGLAPYAYPSAFAANESGWVAQFALHRGEQDLPDNMWFEQWGAAWGASAAPTDSETELGMLVATDAGFLSYATYAEAPEFSGDGITWTPVALPEPSTTIVAAAPFEGELVVATDSMLDGLLLYRVDPKLTTWEPIEHDLDLDGAWSLNEPTSPAFLLSDTFGPNESTIWLLASGDASQWLVEPYLSDDEWIMPTHVAANGSMVLLGTEYWGDDPDSLGDANWLRFDLPG